MPHGELEKVVLARRLTGTLDDGAGLRAMLGVLAKRYPDTWTFAVDGLIGEKTRTAIRHFEKHYRLPVTGEPNEQVLAKLKDIGAL